LQGNCLGRLTKIGTCRHRNDRRLVPGLGRISIGLLRRVVGPIAVAVVKYRSLVGDLRHPGRHRIDHPYPEGDQGLAVRRHIDPGDPEQRRLADNGASCRRCGAFRNIRRIRRNRVRELHPDNVEPALVPQHDAIEQAVPGLHIPAIFVRHALDGHHSPYCRRRLVGCNGLRVVGRRGRRFVQ